MRQFNDLYQRLIFDIHRSHFSLDKKLVDYGILPVIVCRKHQETCTGDGNPPKQYGDCCDGFKCRGLLGGNGRCFEGIFLVIYFCHSNAKI